MTYTFDKLEYVNPPPAAPGAGAAPARGTWNLTHGQMQMNLDLTVASQVTDAAGKPTTVQQPCVLSLTSAATGTIGPADSVTPPQS